MKTAFALIIGLLVSTGALADPNPPSDVTVTAISTTQLDVSWSDTNTTELNYFVERADVIAGPYSIVATLAPNTTIFHDSGLAAGEDYFYRVYASAPVVTYSAQATGSGTTNHNPVAVNDTFAGVNGATITGNVLTNDTDPDNDTLSSVPQTGVFALAANGSFSYAAPATGASYDYPYSISDGKGGNASASVHFDLVPPTAITAFVDPTNGNVPFPRVTRTDTDEVRKLAFPSAEGYGKFADPDIGPGQAFTIFKVSNLNDSGAGSFRACWTATGPRVCIFTVSGTITLATDMLINQNNSNIYVAGQTSPGGIQLASGPAMTAGPLRTVRTNDLVVRYVKARPGVAHVKSTNVQGFGSISGQFSGGVWQGHDIIADHITANWSTDEVFAMVGLDNATMQWSLTSEPIACGPCRSDNNAAHDFSGAFNVTNNHFTMHHNLLMSGRKRMPNIAGNAADVTNNVIYNEGFYAGVAFAGTYATGNSTIVNYVGNWAAHGPRTTNMPDTGQKPHCMYMAAEGAQAPGTGAELYVADNICPHDFTGADNSDIAYLKQPLTNPAGGAQIIFPTPRAGGLSLPTTGAIEAFQTVAKYAGSRQDMFSTPRVDLVEARSLAQLANCANHGYSPAPGQIAAPPAPGYPDLTTGTTWLWTADSDNDGMMDSWELSYAPNLTTLTQNGDHDNDGWSDLEEFLNYLAGDGVEKIADGTVPAPNCGWPAQ